METLLTQQFERGRKMTRRRLESAQDFTFSQPVRQLVPCVETGEIARSDQFQGPVHLCFVCGVGVVLCGGDILGLDARAIIQIAHDEHVMRREGGVQTGQVFGIRTGTLQDLTQVIVARLVLALVGRQMGRKEGQTRLSDAELHQNASLVMVNSGNARILRLDWNNTKCTGKTQDVSRVEDPRRVGVVVYYIMRHHLPSRSMTFDANLCSTNT